MQLEFDYNKAPPITSTNDITTPACAALLSAGTGISQNISSGVNSGAALSAGPASSIHWTSPYTLTPNAISTDFTVKGTIRAKDVDVDGISLTDAIEMIYQRLAILTPNEALEGRWEELKELGDRYRELEKEILDKENVWNKIKD